MADMEESVDISKLKAADLKKLCKERGLPVSGTKAELIQRLEAAEADGDDDLADDILNEEELGGTEEEEDEAVAEAEVSLSAEIEEEETDLVEADTGTTTFITKPVITKITAPVSSEKPVSAVSPEERKAMRAARFGLVSDDSKKSARADRFGVGAGTTTTTGSTKLTGTVTSPASAEDMEKLKRRAERFGTVTSTSLSKATEIERLKQRAERFGSITSGKLSKAEQMEKFRIRAGRFGEITSQALRKADEQDRLLKRKQRFGATVSSVSVGNMDEAKRRRAERFGLNK